jgi:hypothetical protein
MVAKSVCVVVAGCVLAQVAVHKCPTHGSVCEALGEPPHTHSETPRGTFTI